jgi:hypothetical protein
MGADFLPTMQILLKLLSSDLRGPDIHHSTIRLLRPIGHLLRPQGTITEFIRQLMFLLIFSAVVIGPITDIVSVRRPTCVGNKL